MPGLKMTTKPHKKCARGRSLHACRKSNKSFEELRLQIKTCQQASILDTSIQLLDDVSSNDGRSDEAIPDAEAGDDQITIAGNSAQLMKFPLQSSDSAGTEEMVSISVTFTPLLETIFSPAFDNNESKFKLVNDTNAVKAGEHPDLPELVCVDSNDGRWSLNDAQNYKFWDLYTSEVAASSFDGGIGFSNVINSAYQTYEYVQSDLIYDKEDRCMLLPSPEKNMEIGSIYDEKPSDGKTSEEAMISSDDSCLYFAIHQMTKPETGMLYKNSDLEELECNDPQLFLRNLPDLSEASWPSVSLQETRKSKPITLVLDLDETLVHSTLEHCDDADFNFPVFFNMKLHTVYVRRRPHLQTFLERVARMFKIVIFTASQSIYADQLLDILDPDRKLFSQRMYRESCICSDGSYTKDLTILGVDLAKVAIIDNSPQVFRLQVNNGIPIQSWFDDPSDQALISLLPFLETLVDADDVRPIIAKRFNNKEI